jgi:hypothetical protein
MTRSTFRFVWARLAGQSFCDVLGGREFRRVYVEWRRAGKPANLTAFIMERANSLAPPGAPASTFARFSLHPETS